MFNVSSNAGLCKSYGVFNFFRDLNRFWSTMVTLVTIDPKIPLEFLGTLTDGFSGADIKELSVASPDIALEISKTGHSVFNKILNLRGTSKLGLIGQIFCQRWRILNLHGHNSGYKVLSLSLCKRL